MSQPLCTLIKGCLCFPEHQRLLSSVFYYLGDSIPFQKEKSLTVRIIAASEFLVIMQNEECHQSITRGLTSGHRQVTTILM